MDRQAQEAEWYQMVVTDKRGLSGTSVVEFVNPIIRRLGASTVVVFDFDWALFFLYVGG